MRARNRWPALVIVALTLWVPEYLSAGQESEAELERQHRVGTC